MHSKDSDQTELMPRLILVSLGAQSLHWFCHVVAQMAILRSCHLNLQQGPASNHTSIFHFCSLRPPEVSFDARPTKRIMTVVTTIQPAALSAPPTLLVKTIFIFLDRSTLQKLVTFLLMDNETIHVRNEPRHQETSLRGFRPDKTQTGLLSFRS